MIMVIMMMITVTIIIAPFASSQSLLSTLLQAVDLISARTALHGDMTLH